jgi:hypothetical protein
MSLAKVHDVVESAPCTLTCACARLQPNGQHHSTCNLASWCGERRARATTRGPRIMFTHASNPHSNRVMICYCCTSFQALTSRSAVTTPAHESPTPSAMENKICRHAFKSELVASTARDHGVCVRERCPQCRSISLAKWWPRRPRTHVAVYHV